MERNGGGQTLKLRRSLLWVPSNKWDRILEGINSNADCIVLDLEDLVPIKEKVIARDMACKALKELNFRGKERIVRINPINTTLGQEDIAAITKCKPDAIRLPKCESTEYILQLDNAYKYKKKNILYL